MYGKIPGLRLMGLIPEYFDDAASLNYGVLWRWRNPLYGVPGGRFIKPLLVAAYQSTQFIRNPSAFQTRALFLE
jgi:hypothetical protein